MRVGLTPIVVGTALGVGYGNIGGALGEAAFVTRYHHPSDALLQALAAAMQAGCVIGSLFAGWLADTQGRRRTILLALVCVVASGAVLLVPALVALVARRAATVEVAAPDVLTHESIASNPTTSVEIHPGVSMPRVNLGT